MAIKTKTINNSLVYFDDTFQYRLLDTLGVNDIKYILPVGSPTDDSTADFNQFTTTVIENGSGTVVTSNAVAAGSRMLITNPDDDYDGINLQLKGEAFKFDSSYPFYFGIKLAISDATQSDLLVGLCQTKTDLLKTSSAHGITSSAVEGAFFFKLDASTTASMKTYLSGTETNTANYGTAIDTTVTIFELYYDGTTLVGYIDGNFVGEFSASLPTTDLTPSLNFRNGADAVKTCTVDWIRCFQFR